VYIYHCGRTVQGRFFLLYNRLVCVFQINPSFTSCRSFPFSCCFDYSFDLFHLSTLMNQMNHVDNFSFNNLMNLFKTSPFSCLSGKNWRWKSSGKLMEIKR
jgi:hypothetical protein